jgi:enoyl-[acyl-carrier protein] reductase II
LPTFVGVREIVTAAGDVPVLAAGGVVDGHGLAAALSLGAQGAIIGTRLLATKEATVANEYKQQLVNAGSEDTLLTSLFGRDMPDFNPMRVLRNSIVEEWAGRENAAPSEPDSQPVVGRMSIMGQELPIHRFQTLVPVAGATGDFEEMPLLSGQGVGGISDLPGAQELLERIAREAADVLLRLAKAVHA